MRDVVGRLLLVHGFIQTARSMEPLGRAVAAASQGTNVISAAYLRCAAAGQASGALFDALQSLLAGRDAAVEAALDSLQAIGHTSGLDALAGAVAVCAALSSTRQMGG